jgi:hypothetical protein
MRSRLLLLAFVVIALALGLATFCGKEEPSRRSSELEERLETLRSVPYTSVTSEKVSEDTAGVMFIDRDRAWPGYNFYCSRLAPEAFLLDLDGNIVNRWSYEQEPYKLWDHAILLDNGDIVVLNKFLYIFQLDWNSNLIWEKRMAAHHDVAMAEDGMFFVIEFSTARHRDLFVRFARVVHLAAGGEELGRWSTYDHLDDLKHALDQASFLDTTLDTLEARGIKPDSARAAGVRIDVFPLGKQERKNIYDYFHLNTITILPETPLAGRDARFAAGNLLLCLRNVNQLAIINWDSGEVLWSWGEGVLEWPHHPTVLEDGNFLVFDNGVDREYSKVLELDPISKTVVWEYVAHPPETFYSPSKGSAQRLPNGNTLICDGDRGRVFEVTREGDIVWDWYNPIIREHRRVQVYRMMRYPVETVESILGR